MGLAAVHGDRKPRTGLLIFSVAGLTLLAGGLLAAWYGGLLGDAAHDAGVARVNGPDPTAADREAHRERIKKIGDYSDVPNYE